MEISHVVNQLGIKLTSVSLTRPVSISFILMFGGIEFNRTKFLNFLLDDD